jgi:hypothetical protein
MAARSATRSVATLLVITAAAAVLASCGGGTTKEAAQALTSVSHTLEEIHPQAADEDALARLLNTGTELKPLPRDDFSAADWSRREDLASRFDDAAISSLEALSSQWAHDAYFVQLPSLADDTARQSLTQQVYTAFLDDLKSVTKDAVKGIA